MQICPRNGETNCFSLQTAYKDCPDLFNKRYREEKYEYLKLSLSPELAEKRTFKHGSCYLLYD